MEIYCSWCLKYMGEIAPDEPGITHGICEECKAKVLAEWNSAEWNSQDNVLTPEDGDTTISPPLRGPRPSFHRKVKCKK